jgi:hypothetical protein
MASSGTSLPLTITAVLQELTDMAFNPLAAVIVANVVDHLADNPTVVELGNQSFAVSDDMIDTIAEKLRKSKKKIDFGALAALKGKQGTDKLPLTAAYYKALGFKSYDAIDVNDKFGSLMMDLNEDLRTQYNFTTQYDLVTNSGTGEHLFNQYAVFKNMHDLTKVGGIMLHNMPFVNWVNHAFYSFHPVLYADVAVANGYEIKRLTLGNRWGFEVEIDTSSRNTNSTSVYPETYAEKVLRKLRGRPPVSRITFDESMQQIANQGRNTPLAIALEQLMAQEEQRTQKDFPNVSIIAALQKTSDAPFSVPMQGKYAKDITSTEIAEGYRPQLV